MEKLLHIVMILGFIYAAWSAFGWIMGCWHYTKATTCLEQEALTHYGTIYLRRTVLSLVISLTIYFVA